MDEGGSTDRDLALRLLRGLEDGGMAASEAAIAAEDLDPVLVYIIVGFLRAVHPASSPTAHAVLERVVNLTGAYPAIVEKSQEGEEDPVSQWFASVTVAHHHKWQHKHQRRHQHVFHCNTFYHFVTIAFLILTLS